MRILIVLLLTCSFSATGKGAIAQTADEIIQKHIQAIGGTDNWNKVKAIKLTGTASQMGMDIKIIQTISDEKGCRTDIIAGGQKGFIIVTPAEGWTFIPFGGMQIQPRKMPDDELKMTLEKMKYKNSQLTDKSCILQATMEGIDTINGQSCYKIKVKGKQGINQICFIDTKTYYMDKVISLNKSGDEIMELAITYGNYMQQAEGITLPMTITTTEGSVYFKTAEINPVIDNKIFAPEN